MKKVIIIGAGLAGLTAAVDLSKNGYQVSIYEIQNNIGGRCCSKFYDGFRFDLGASLYLMPEVIQKVFDEIGIKKKLKLIQCDPIYKLIFEDSSYNIPAKKDEIVKVYEKIEPGSSKNYNKLQKEYKKVYEIFANKILTKRITSIFDILKILNIQEIKYLSSYLLHKLYKKMSSEFNSKKIVLALSFQCLYLGIHLKKSPYAYGILSYTEQTKGLFYPKGGMQKIPDLLWKTAKKNGAKLYLNSDVTKVLIKNNKAVGILVNNQKIYADIVVSNIDLGNSIYKKIIPPIKKNILKSKSSCSTINIYWGMDSIIKLYKKLETHNLFFTNNYIKAFDNIFINYKPPKKPLFYLHLPSKIDKTCLAKKRKNCEVVTILIPISNLKKKYSNYNQVVNEMRKKVIERIEKYTGIKNFEKHIIYEKINTPITWESEFNLYRGSITGLNHNIGNMLHLRPGIKHSYVKNLYLTGSSIQYGAGVPLVISCGHTTSKVIRENDLI